MPRVQRSDHLRRWSDDLCAEATCSQERHEQNEYQCFFHADCPPVFIRDSTFEPIIGQRPEMILKNWIAFKANVSLIAYMNRSQNSGNLSRTKRGKFAVQTFPKISPAMITRIPPPTTCSIESNHLVPKKRWRMAAMRISSIPTTTNATARALRKSGTRKGSVCPAPPRKVMNPVIAPRMIGLPRPVKTPSSDKASEKAMLIPAPVAAAMPTRNAVIGWRVANAAAKMGASVETDPSMRPARPGCTTCKRKPRSDSSWLLLLCAGALRFRLRASPGQL